MINRSKMRRQLYRGGGITGLYPRQKYGLGDFVRKLIPNELADIAVKAAPFVAPFNPGVAGLMRGIGRYDQRGSLSDALKQGLATTALGAGARYLGGQRGMEDIMGGGLRGGLTNPISADSPLRDIFKARELTSEQQKIKDLKNADSIKNTPGFMQRATEATIGKVPGLKALPPMVQQQLLVGGLIGGTKYLINYLKGDFRPQEEGESMEEYLAARKETVGQQMRIYMDNYFKFDPEYSQLDDAGKNAFVARYNVAQGGRIGFQTGGIGRLNPDKTLVQVGINPGTGTPEWMYPHEAAAMGIYPTMNYEGNKITEGTMMDLVENISDPGSPYYEAAKTLQDRKAQNEAALDLLNTTGTTGTTSMMQQPGETFDDFLARGGDPYYTQNETAIRSGMMPATPTGEAGRIITDGNIKYRINADGSRTPIGGINVGGTTFYENAQGRGPGTYDTYDGTTFTAADNFYEMEKDIARRTAPEPASPRTVTPEGTALKVAAPEVAPQRTIAPTIKAEPEGIQTIPGEKKVFNVMMDEKGNVMKDQGIAQLARDTGVAPYIQNYPINSMSDVMRMIGPGTGIPQGTEYDSISMDRSLRENVAANEAQRQRVSRMFEAARSKLPGYGPGPVMPMQTNQYEKMFTNPGVVTQANPGGYRSEQEAIADLGIEKYNQLYNQGGRVGLKHGTPEMGIKSLDAGAPDITYEGNEGPQAPMKMASAQYYADMYSKYAQDMINKGVTPMPIEDFIKMIKEQEGNMSRGPVLPEDPTKPINPFAPKPTGPVLPDKMMAAKGGRIGYKMGMGPAGLPGIPRMAPDGIEFDMRQNGGFQPLGAKEKKDDVPAMLAKNEFVMTADAVRGAGNGDIELGAQKMYDTMKNLERRMA